MVKILCIVGVESINVNYKLIEFWNRLIVFVKEMKRWGK